MLLAKTGLPTIHIIKLRVTDMLETQHLKNKNLFIHTDIDDLLTELTFYRTQSAKLQKVNELYRKIAGITELPAMIEAYSAWLTQYVPHLLIGYNNDTYQRMHLYCSIHGPDRRKAIETAEKLIKQDAVSKQRYYRIKDLHAYNWRFVSERNSDQLLLLRKGHPITQEEQEFINESFEILTDPLRKAIDFEKILNQARKDTLTGLPNRRVFDERIHSIMEHARRHNHPLTLAAMDLDNFKKVNDTKGHLFGDIVLQQVANALQKEIRLSDLLVRMGGDEFILVLSDTNQQAAINLCERLCRSVDALKVRAGEKNLGLSIGVMEWTPDMSKQQWLEKADDVLYQMKAQGGAGVAVN